MSNPLERREKNRIQPLKQLDEYRYTSIIENDLATYWIKKAWNEPPLKWMLKYPGKEAQLIYERFLLLRDMFQLFLSDEFKDYADYKKGCEIIRDNLPRVEDAIKELESRNDVQPGARIFDDEFNDLTAPNMQQGVSFKCLDVIKELSRKYTNKNSEYILKNAYKQECCQSEVRDGIFKEIGSWETLRNRIRDNHPDIYKKTHKQ